MVAINRNNEIFLSGKSVRLTTVHGDFISLAKRYPHAYVSIEADAKASYGTVLQVADAAKSAGLDVGLSP
jgi:biopolymer transport protein ExbD